MMNRILRILSAVMVIAIVMAGIPFAFAEAGEMIELTPEQIAELTAAPKVSSEESQGTAEATDERKTVVEDPTIKVTLEPTDAIPKEPTEEYSAKESMDDPADAMQESAIGSTPECTPKASNLPSAEITVASEVELTHEEHAGLTPESIAELSVIPSAEPTMEASVMNPPEIIVLPEWKMNGNVLVIPYIAEDSTFTVRWKFEGEVKEYKIQIAPVVENEEETLMDICTCTDTEAEFAITDYLDQSYILYITAMLHDGTFSCGRVIFRLQKVNAELTEEVQGKEGFSEETGEVVALDAIIEEPHVHVPALTKAVEPTCTEPGLSEGSICSVCGITLIPQMEISPTEHNFLKRPGGICRCEVCGVTFVTSAEEIQLNAFELKLGVAEKFTLTPVLSSGENAKFSFSSENAKIATVDKKGIVTAKNVGETIITVTSGELNVECTIVVVKAPTKVILSSTKLSMGTGQMAVLTTVLNNGNESKVTFATNKATVATVDENGVITAVGKGTARITATSYNKKKATCLVNVLSAPESISLNENSLTLPVGIDFILETSVNKGAATGFRFASSNENVASVENSGNIATHIPGTAIITATTYNGLTAECKVTVVPAPVTVSLNTDRAILGVREKFQLTASNNQNCAAGYTYTSSNDKIASVDKNGRITANKVGNATITVTSYNGLNAFCYVTVAKIPTKITLSAKTLKMGVGQVENLIAKLNNGSAGTISFMSSNPNVVSVDANGRITALTSGKATITAKTYNNKKAVCNVTVFPAPTTLELAETIAELPIGMTLDLKPAVEKGSMANFTCTSSDENIAVVDNNGIITAVNTGKVIISVTTHNGISASCTITVTLAPKKVYLNTDNLELGLKETFQLEASTDQGGKQIFSYHSSKDSVVSVSKGGLLTAKKVGTAVITVSTFNGVETQCKITVKKAPSSIWLNIKELELDAGETFQLLAELNNGSTGKISYSSDSACVSVDENGLITAVSEGKARITAKVYNGKAASCVVIVSAPKLPLSIEDVVSDMQEYKIGDSVTWTVTAIGGSGRIEYNYELYLNGNRIHSKENNGAQFLHIIENAGVYVLKVTARDESGISVSYTAEQLTVAVSESPIIIESIYSDGSERLIGDTATWHVSISEGTGTITFNYELKLGDQLVHSQQSTNSHFSWTLDKTGEYILTVKAIDENGSEAIFTTDAVLCVAEFEVTPAEEFTHSPINGLYTSITGYKGNRENVVIPEMIDGYAVQKIGNKAFSKNTTLQSIIVPDTVIEIGNSAFSKCTSLTEANLPDSVEVIGDAAFHSCEQLSYFHYPMNWKTATGYAFQDGIFYGCKSLKEVVVPEGVTAIPSLAFHNAKALEKIVLPGTLRIIGKDAFKDCPRLKIWCEYGSVAYKYAQNNSIPVFYLSLSGASVPSGRLYKGDSFVLYGYVRSSDLIQSIRGTIYNSDGTSVLQRFTVEPGVKDYNLNGTYNFNLKFGSLDLGNYVYELVAVAGTETKTLAHSSFTIAPQPLRMQINNLSVPEGISSIHSIAGTIVSNYKLTSVRIALTLNGVETNRVYTASPNSMTFDISAANRTLDLASLPSTAEYGLKITATANSETRVICNTLFKGGIFTGDIDNDIYKKAITYALKANATDIFDSRYINEALGRFDLKTIVTMALVSRDDWLVGMVTKLCAGHNEYLVDLYEKEICSTIQEMTVIPNMFGSKSQFDETVETIAKAVLKANGIYAGIKLKEVEDSITLSKEIKEIAQDFDFSLKAYTDFIKAFSWSMDTAEDMVKILLSQENGIRVLNSLEEEMGASGIPEFEEAFRRVKANYLYGTKTNLTTQIIRFAGNEIVDTGIKDVTKAMADLAKTVVSGSNSGRVSGGALYSIVTLSLDTGLKLTGVSDIADNYHAFMIQVESYNKARKAYVNACTAIKNNDTSNAAVIRFMNCFNYAKQATIRIHETILELKNTPDSELQEIQAFVDSIKNLDGLGFSVESDNKNHPHAGSR